MAESLMVVRYTFQSDGSEASRTTGIRLTSAHGRLIHSRRVTVRFPERVESPRPDPTWDPWTRTTTLFWCRWGSFCADGDNAPAGPSWLGLVRRQTYNTWRFKPWTNWTKIDDIENRWTTITAVPYWMLVVLLAAPWATMLAIRLRRRFRGH